MHTVRIFVGALPRMMRAIVEDVVREQPDMQLVGPDFADVAIVADDGSNLLRQQPLPLGNLRLKVLAVSPNGRTARLLEMRETLVAPVSPQGLVAAIRAAAGGGAH